MCTSLNTNLKKNLKTEFRTVQNLRTLTKNFNFSSYDEFLKQFPVV